MRVRVRLRRPRLPHFGHGAFLGAQRTGIVTIVGASVTMLASFRGEGSLSSFTGTQALSFKGKMAYGWPVSGGVQRGVSQVPGPRAGSHALPPTHARHAHATAARAGAVRAIP